MSAEGSRNPPSSEIQRRSSPEVRPDQWIPLFPDSQTTQIAQLLINMTYLRELVARFEIFGTVRFQRREQQEDRGYAGGDPYSGANFDARKLARFNRQFCRVQASENGSIISIETTEILKACRAVGNGNTIEEQMDLLIKAALIELAGDALRQKGDGRELPLAVNIFLLARLFQVQVIAEPLESHTLLFISTATFHLMLSMLVNYQEWYAKFINRRKLKYIRLTPKRRVKRNAISQALHERLLLCMALTGWNERVQLMQNRQIMVDMQKDQRRLVRSAESTQDNIGIT